MKKRNLPDYELAQPVFYLARAKSCSGHYGTNETLPFIHQHVPSPKMLQDNIHKRDVMDFKTLKSTDLLELQKLCVKRPTRAPGLSLQAAAAIPVVLNRDHYAWERAR